MLENADDILSTDDRPTKTSHIDAWDEDIIIRALSGFHRSQLEALGGKIRDGDVSKGIMWDYYSLCVIKSVVDSKGDLVFKKKDKQRLREKSAAAIEQIADEVLKLSGLNPEDIEDAAGN